MRAGARWYRDPLAIVPRGTANLAARALGLPFGLDAALATGFGGRDRRVDLAVADGMPFAAMAGMGLDAAVVAATPDVLKPRLGWLAYAAAGMAHLPGRSHEFQVCMDDGQPVTRRARCVVVGNTGLLPGGFVLLPGARLDDGLLDVGILAPPDLLGWGRVAHRVLTQASRNDRPLERYTARRIEDPCPRRPAAGGRRRGDLPGPVTDDHAVAGGAAGPSPRPVINSPCAELSRSAARRNPVGAPVGGTCGPCRRGWRQWSQRITQEGKDND